MTTPLETTCPTCTPVERAPTLTWGAALGQAAVLLVCLAIVQWAFADLEVGLAWLPSLVVLTVLLHAASYRR